MSFLKKLNVPSPDDAEVAEQDIQRLKKKKEEREDRGKKLSGKEQALLDDALLIKTRYNRFVAAVMGGALALVSAGGAALVLSSDDNEDEPAPQTSAVSSDKPKKPKKPRSKSKHFSVDPNDPDGPVVNLTPVPGMLSTLEPVETCKDMDPVAFRRKALNEKFGSVIEDCDGNLRSNGKTYLKCTIPGYKANSQLFIELEKIFLQTGVVDRTTKKFGKRTFVFHREDGKDGLPMGDYRDFDAPFTKQAKTQAMARVSHSFTNIPLSGDNLDDIKGLAVEICQTLVIPKYPVDANKSEIICNSYGMAVGCAYSGMPYEQYARLAQGTAIMLKEGGEKLRFDVYDSGIYGRLSGLFADKPDILEAAK